MANSELAGHIIYLEKRIWEKVSVRMSNKHAALAATWLKQMNKKIQSSELNQDHERRADGQETNIKKQML